MGAASDSQHWVSHELIEFVINVFKGDDFVISAFVSEHYLPSQGLQPQQQWQSSYQPVGGQSCLACTSSLD